MKYTALFTLLACSYTAYANTPITLMNTSQGNSSIPLEQVIKLVKQNVYTNDYRQIKAQVIDNKQQQPSYLLVYLFSKRYHHVDVAKINIDSHYQASSDLQRHYQLNTQDFTSQPHLKAAVCPDPKVQFIAFAPNDMQLEQDITEGVAKQAEAAGLKTVRLYIKQATSQNYINYMSCPKVVGNFYDGDANPQIITTNDGVVSSNDFDTTLKGAFRQHVTNFWLACEAFNDPMKSAVIDSAGAQKYAAGINDLLIGPSDRAAACAMKASIKGTTIDKAFNSCVQQEDDPDKTGDQWGFGGNGSDQFGQ